MILIKISVLIKKVFCWFVIFSGKTIVVVGDYEVQMSPELIISTSQSIMCSFIPSYDFRNFVYVLSIIRK